MPGLQPAHMLDQSHNVTDPIESLMTSAIELQRAYAQALLVDRDALAALPAGQRRAAGATQTLKRAFTTDVAPILARARLRRGGAIDPIGLYRPAATVRPARRRGRRRRAAARAV